MSDFADKAQDKADELAGKAKDVAGDLTDDSSLQAEGKIDQGAAKAKQAAGQLGDAAENTVDQVKKSRGPVSALHRVGMQSEWIYAAGFASIGLSLGSWLISRNKTGDSKAQSDRWGIFIGHWAPTFMALGVALKADED